MTAGENARRDRFMISPYLHISISPSQCDDAPASLGASPTRPAGVQSASISLRYRTNGPRDRSHRRACPIVIDCYREGWLEPLLTFERVVVVSPMKISVTTLVSGSINM